MKSMAEISHVENTAYIFAGFTPFRMFCKAWQRNYDRIFNPNGTEDESARAVQNLPSNVLNDLYEIAPGELAGNALSSAVLATAKMSFKKPEPPLQGNLAQVKAGFTNDWLSSVIAYTPFFELNDRVYDMVSGGKDNPTYYAKLQGKEPPAPLPKDGAYAALTQDGIGRVAFNRVGSLLLGIAPYIASQRLVRSQIGGVQPGVNSYAKSVMQEYAAYAPFALYTATAEIYNKAYDDLFRQLEARDAEQKQK